MAIIWWILIGLLAGLLAKALMPGDNKEPKGWIMTIGLGIVGSVIMGFVMDAFGFQRNGGLVPTLVGATIGACLLIFLCRKLWK